MEDEKIEKIADDMILLKADHMTEQKRLLPRLISPSSSVEPLPGLT